MNLQFQADAGPWLGLLLALALAGVAFAFYRRELRRDYGALGLLLPALRAAAVFLVLMIVTQPLLRHRYTTGQLAKIRVLVDASGSMSVTDPDLAPDRKLLQLQRWGWLPPDTVDLRLADAAETIRQAVEAAGEVAAGAPGAVELADRVRAFDAAIDTTYANLRKMSDAAESVSLVQRGTILREYWTGLSGTGFQSLLQAHDYPDKPAGISYQSEFEAPLNWNDHYGTRLRGFIHPPVTGDYLFWIYADERAELWLSSSENPADKRLIANVQTPTGHRQWDRSPEQASKPVRLEAGRRYYIEAIHVEDTGADFVGVGWRLPDQTLERPIPGTRLSPVDLSAEKGQKRVTDDREDRFRTELVTPAHVLVKRTDEPPKIREDLTRLGQTAAAWERNLRDTFEFRAREVLAANEPQTKAAVERFDKLTRWQRLQVTLLTQERPLLAQLAAQHDVELLALTGDKAVTIWESRAGRLGRAGKVPPAFGLEAIAPLTDLAKPVSESVPAEREKEEGKDKAPAKPKAGEAAPPERGKTAIVLFSDGRHNALESPLDVAKVLGNRGVSLFTVASGAAAELRDLAVVSIDCPETVFFKDRVKGTVLLEDAMPAGTPFVLKIECDGQALWEKKLETQNGNLRKVEFDFPIEALVAKKMQGFDKALRFTSLPLDMRVSVTNLKDDRETRNNEAPLRVRAILQKYKALLIEGRPRWEWQYVRNILERDDQWSLNSVLVEAIPADAAAAAAAATVRKDGEVSPRGRSDQEEISGTEMIRRGSAPGMFPVDRETLFTYDLIILGEVPKGILRRAELEWIRDFVGDRGGGLVLIDGQRGYLKGYADKALGTLFPVRWLDKAPAGMPTAWQITGAGNRLAALQFAPTAAENAKLWASFAPPHWTAPVQALPGAETLVECLYGKESAPALVLRRFGSGKVLYAAFDESWRLRKRVGDKYQPRYWNQVGLWIMEQPFAVSDRYVSLDAGPLLHRPGEKVEIRARLRGEDGKPLSAATARVVLLRDGKPVAKMPLVPDEQGGVFRATTAPLEVGAYLVRVSMEDVADEFIKAETRFTVAAPDVGELALLSSNEDLLRQMATVAKGVSVREENASHLVERLKPLSEGKVVESETLLWQSYWWFAAIVLLLTAEWVLRKRTGLL